ncbi:hypothetical protein [Variovorax ginsengisoli]|uniref:Uncharacterized protein n=1 Tax=Variovorax ginsengisoli TaxID=363844 RepID=A0ABT9SE61_9BURK|nr:hypothetical protein [Variovorax ginsengisoli]MDP9902639.1 hypothetical protein [Variovorax ginsengisoli]
MKPVSHPSNTRVLQAPAGWDQSGTPVEPLGITDMMCPGDVPAVMSFWEPDEVDRANIAGGGLVGLSIIGRTMQPAVVVSVAPDERVWPRDHPAVAVGIEDAARWVDARREVFDAEHGMTDPETGAFEYGTGPGAVARSEYSAELQEIAEGIRGLMSTNTRPRFGSTRPMAVDLSQDDRDKLFAELFGRYGITSPVEDVVETVMRFLETSGVIQTSPVNSVSESAAESPTHGMTLGERIAHVGGRTNAQGYIEFGSPMAVDALIRHAIRDRDTASQAQPTREEVEAEVVTDAELAPLAAALHARLTAPVHPLQKLHDLLFAAQRTTGEAREKAINEARIVLYRLRAQQASAAEPAKYDDVLIPFVELMRAELHANSSKGDRPGWLLMSRDRALLEIYYHVSKLSVAIKNDDAAGIAEHSADVANMAMMALDVCGALVDTAPQQAADSSKGGAA